MGVIHAQTQGTSPERIVREGSSDLRNASNTALVIGGVQQMRRKGMESWQACGTNMQMRGGADAGLRASDGITSGYLDWTLLI